MIGLNRCRPWAAAGIAFLALVPGAPARAQTPACGQDSVGQLSDQAGVRCQCVESAGGRITGEASGFRWDCGILRGRMNQFIPATPNAYQGALPESIIIDPAEIPVEQPGQPWTPPHRGRR